MGLRHGTGVATYGRNLSRSIKRIGFEVDVLFGRNSTHSRSPLLSEVAFFDSPRVEKAGLIRRANMFGDALTSPLGCEVDSVPVQGNVIWNSVRERMPEFDRVWNSTFLYQRANRTHRWFGKFAAIARPQVEIAHWTYPIPIRHSQSLNIYTLHDLVPLRLPHTTLDNKKKYFSLCQEIAATAAHIVTVSENSRSDIINLLGVSPDRVTNTYQAVEFPAVTLEKTDEVVSDEVKGTFGLDFKGYFLFFGAIEPKKNLGRLVEAYLASGVASPLVIVGAPGWGGEDELRFLKSITEVPFSGHAARAGRSSQILRLEYLPQAVLVSLIRAAKATLFPSLYEGFGLPAVESMLLGTAVITSNTSCMPEIAGDAAVFTDPYDTGDLAAAIRAVDSDIALRNQLESAGRRRASFFSPMRFDERMRELYLRIR